MKILVACEESQAVCSAFRKLGHEAYSADVQECSGGHPEWHIVGDVLPLINGNCEFDTQSGEHVVIDGRWDILIAHPPCTYLTNAGAVRMRVNGIIQEDRFRRAMEARDFFMRFLHADCGHICIENPVPMKIVGLPAYDQIIQPYEYGHPYSKRTCLWLKGLPKLVPTNILDHHKPFVNGGNKKPDGTYRQLKGRNERDQKTRSKTFPGIAEAIATQYSAYVEEENDEHNHGIQQEA